jgi:eukaryotic-like serine/threonine-protein kinase
MAVWNPEANDIFLKALEIRAPEQRRAYLDEACHGDADVRAQVDALLEASERAGSFLDAPAADLASTTDEPPREGPGTVIGPYKLLQELGEGGMGTVFLAEQEEPVRRKVALKIIKAGMDSARVIARFEQERQALAMMDHPNIAKVLDAGATSAGRPYFVMELVKGIPITRFCDQEHLTPKERLELFIPVCQAVQHAHQKGIIHRDVKPSNVLIALYDGKSIPKVIDFGVAKAIQQKLTERTMFTEVGQMVGTLEYMAPEQAELNNLDIDTRADIYSLGVLLYELLTGSPPFTSKQLRSAAFDEMLRMIREVEPQKPSTKLSGSDELPSIAANRKLEPKKLTKLVHGELDWIVMKCLEKERGRRYETANGLAFDVQRFLADEPVLAGPPSATYRLRKFMRRNKGPVLAALAILILLVGGSVGTSAGLVWALAAEQETRGALIEVTAQERRAVAAEKSATAAARRAERIYAFYKQYVLVVPRPAGQDGGLGKDVTMKEALDRAAPKIAEAFADDPVIEASVRHTFGVTYTDLGRYKTAHSHLQKALEFRSAALGPEHDDTRATQTAMAIALDKLGNHADAEKLLRQILEIERPKLGPEHEDTLGTMHNLGAVLKNQGKIDEAARLFRKELAVRERQLPPEHRDLLATRQDLATLLIYQNKRAEAESLLRDVLKIRLKVHPDHPETFYCMQNLGMLLRQEEKMEEAEEMLRRCLAGERRIFEADDPRIAGTQYLLADVLIVRGKRAEAEKLLRETLELQRRVNGDDDRKTLRTQRTLATLLARQEKLPEAETLFRQLLRVQTAARPEAPDTLSTQFELALLLKTKGSLNEAEDLYRATLTAQVQVLPADHPDIVATQHNLGILLSDRGKPAEAEAFLRSAWESRRRTLGPDDPDTLRVETNLGLTLRHLGKLSEAEPLTRHAFDVRRRTLGPDADLTLRSQTNLGLLLQGQGKLAEAESVYQDLLQRQRKLLPAEHNALAVTLANLGEILVDNRKAAQAEPLLRECLSMRQKHLPDGWTTFNTESVLGASLLGQKEYADAEPLLLEGYQGLKARQTKIPLQEKDRRLREALERLVQLYDAWGKPDEAAKWRKELEAMKKEPELKESDKKP